MGRDNRDDDFKPSLSSSPVRPLIEIYDGVENTAPYRKSRKLWVYDRDGEDVRGGIILIYKFHLRPSVNAVFQLPEGFEHQIDEIEATESMPAYAAIDLGFKVHFLGVRPNEEGLVTGACEINIRRTQIYSPRDRRAEELEDKAYLSLPENALVAISYIDEYISVNFSPSSEKPEHQLVIAPIRGMAPGMGRKYRRLRTLKDNIEEMKTERRKGGAIWCTEVPDRRRKALAFLYPYG